MTSLSRVPSIEPLADRPKTMGWMTTFNDLITLLMVFFVLLFALSSIDIQRYHKFRRTLQSATGILLEERNTSVGILTADAPVQAAATVDAPIAAHHLEALVETEGLEAEYTHGGVRITLSDTLLFASGSAQLTAEGLKMLERIGSMIETSRRAVRVEGHTDDVPIETARFPSNWELSTQRAVNVVKYFIDHAKVEPKRLSAAGYGASRPRVANDSRAARTRNRRVEIILGAYTP